MPPDVRGRREKRGVYDRDTLLGFGVQLGLHCDVAGPPLKPEADPVAHYLYPISLGAKMQMEKEMGTISRVMGRYTWGFMRVEVFDSTSYYCT